MKRLRYALYAGCTAKQSTPELWKSTMAVADKLGIELVDLKEVTCCGASHLRDFDAFLSMVLNARNICYAEMKNLDMVTICNTCQNNIAFVKAKLDEDAQLRLEVNEHLAEIGLKYKGTSSVRHFMYALIEDYGLDHLAKKVVKPLKNINIAPFYGCHNIRPFHIQSGFNMGENPFYPRGLDNLILALQGKPVEYAYKNRCCGFHVDLQAPKTANKLTGLALTDAVDNGADLMVTPCPLCQLNMDVKQKSASKAVSREIKLPVLHLSQLIGLAIGINPKDLGLEHNLVQYGLKEIIS